MSKLNIDNPVFQIMGRIGDIAGLNLLWLVCCLPVVTAGASTTALFHAARRMLDGEESRVCRDFFRSFRRNFQQATALWLILLAAGALFAADVLISYRTPGGAGSLFRGAGWTLCLLWLAASGNAFALLARYEYTVRRVLVDAFRLALRRPLSAVVSTGMAALLPVIGWIDLNFAIYLLPLWVLTGGALYALALTAALLPVFRSMEEQP